MAELDNENGNRSHVVGAAEAWPGQGGATTRTSPPIINAIKFLLIVAAVNFLAWLVLRLAHFLFGSESAEADFKGRILTLCLIWAVFTVLATRVGYKPMAAALGFFVPGYSFVFAAKVMWRLANLPKNRYWDREPITRPVGGSIPPV